MGCGGSKADAKGAGAKKEEVEPTGVLPSKSNQEDIRDKYDIGKVLGSGSFGQVREATLKNGDDVRAVKMIERDNEDGEWSNQAIFAREVGLMQQINHENIIRFFDFYQDVHFLYVVMEICRGGEVFAKIVELKRFSEKNAAMLGQQMLRAMDYIHKMNIVHRDIKAENYIFAAPEISSAVKMIDFGMATKFEHGQVLTELCGSPHYLAPELIGQKYNHIADVWAFGVLLYLLMYGHYPYDAKQPRDIMVKILTDPIQWQSSKAKLSKDCIDLLKKLLEHNPKKRLTSEEALNHPWMKLAQSVHEGEAISTETLRSAHKKVTATRKQVDVKIDKLRNDKLQKIEEDFTKGIRHGQRLGETPKELFMNHPEFLRRDNKLTTAPSSQIQKRKMSLTKLIGGGKGDVITIAEDEEEGAAGAGGPSSLPKAAGRQRAASLAVIPRRLSYIGNITPQEEGNLKRLHTERTSKPDEALPGVAESGEDAKPARAVTP